MQYNKLGIDFSVYVAVGETMKTKIKLNNKNIIIGDTAYDSPAKEVIYRLAFCKKRKKL